MWNKLIIIFISFLSFYCFEYEEKIFFRKGFSGHVEIFYIVPLKKDNSSLVKFLPVDEQEINSRINKKLFSSNLKIRDYTFEFIPDDVKFSVLPNHKRGKISYKIDFNQPDQLEGALLGNLFVQKKSNTLTVRREFKSVVANSEQTTSTGEKKIKSETLKLLGENQILFKVFLPNDAECYPNTKGDTSSLPLTFKLPLAETVEKPGNKIWQYKLVCY